MSLRVFGETKHQYALKPYAYKNIDKARLRISVQSPHGSVQLIRHPPPPSSLAKKF